MSTSQFTFTDLFAGMGGFRLALESLGGACVKSSEISPKAKEVYGENWADEPGHNAGDIRKVTFLPDHDLMVGGVPCQAWSISGKNLGFEDSRGQLWWDTIRLLRASKPRGFIFENVKGLTDPRNAESFQFILNELETSGYEVSWKLLNAYDFGLPQNRERVFIVGSRTGLRNFQWPTKVRSDRMLLHYMEGMQHLETSARRAPDPDGEVSFNKLTAAGERNEFFVLCDIRHGPTSVHSWELKDLGPRADAICMALLRNRRNAKYGDRDGNPLSTEALTALVPRLELAELEALRGAGVLEMLDGKWDFRLRRLSGGYNGVYRVYLPNARFFSTLTATGMKDAVATELLDADTDEEYRRLFVDRLYRPGKYRFPTARECARLQGFPDSHRLHRREEASKFLIGNSVPPPIVRGVAENLLQSI